MLSLSGTSLAPQFSTYLPQRLAAANCFESDFTLLPARQGRTMNTLELGCSEFHFQILVNGCLVTKIKSLALAASPQEL